MYDGRSVDSEKRVIKIQLITHVTSNFNFNA